MNLKAINVHNFIIFQKKIKKTKLPVSVKSCNFAHILN